MKRFAIAAPLFLFISTVGFSQAATYGNFRLLDQEIIYQKVFFQDSVTVGKLHAYYSSLPFVTDAKVSGDDLSFQINDLVVDYKKFGFSQVATPGIIQTGKYSGVVYAEAKDGKYRITVRAIQLTGDIGYKKIVTKENLTNYACRDNGTYISGDWTKPNTLGLLDKAFTDKLQYVEKAGGKDQSDW
jgi:hypothetical protein